MNPALKHLYLQAFHDAAAAQDDLNMRLNPDWAKQGWKYYRAAWLEMAESIGHLNWSWWKTGSYGEPPTAAERAQLFMEFSDIYHFGLSMDLVYYSGDGRYDSIAKKHYRVFQAAADREAKQEYICSVDGGIDLLETLVVNTIQRRDFDLETFVTVCRAWGLTADNLLALYNAKRALNQFRWNNGYSLPKGDPAAYRKMWPSAGKQGVLEEDNVHLTEIMARALPTQQEEHLVGTLLDGVFHDEVMRHLDQRYNHKLPAHCTARP